MYLPVLFYVKNGFPIVHRYQSNIKRRFLRILFPTLKLWNLETFGRHSQLRSFLSSI